MQDQDAVRVLEPQTEVSIEIGGFSVRATGSEEFILSSLPDLVSEIAGRIEEVEVQPRPSGTGDSNLNGQSSSNGQLRMTTSTIASKLGCKTGIELAQIAATKLTLVDGRDTFTRQQMLVEMKTAPSFHKETYRKNLSGIISSLIKGDKIREVSSGQFALEESTKQDALNQLT